MLELADYERASHEVLLTPRALEAALFAPAPTVHVHVAEVDDDVVASLDWNEPAIGFYRSLGAQPMDEWTVYRLNGKALADLGEGLPVELSD